MRERKIHFFVLIFPISLHTLVLTAVMALTILLETIPVKVPVLLLFFTPEGCSLLFGA